MSVLLFFPVNQDSSSSSTTAYAHNFMISPTSLLRVVVIIFYLSDILHIHKIHIGGENNKTGYEPACNPDTAVLVLLRAFVSFSRPNPCHGRTLLGVSTTGLYTTQTKKQQQPVYTVSHTQQPHTVHGLLTILLPRCILSLEKICCFCAAVTLSIFLVPG